MDREYYWRIGSYLTPEQIRHEENGREKIRQLYGNATFLVSVFFQMIIIKLI